MTAKKKETVYLKDLHFENKLWLNELKFYKEEIKIFEKRLSEIVKRNTTQKVMVKVEQFQNKFITHQEVIHDLKHKIKQNEKALSRFAEENPVAIDRHHFTDHTETRDEMNSFREIFNEMKSSFMRHLAEWM